MKGTKPSFEIKDVPQSIEMGKKMILGKTIGVILWATWFGAPKTASRLGKGNGEMPKRGRQE